MKSNTTGTMIGVVSKKSGEKTYKVEISEKKAHPLYRKIVVIKKSFLAHSELPLEIGTTVTLEPAKKISKRKSFVVVGDKLTK